MKNVRIGIIGVGNIGTLHLTNILSGKIDHVELVAVCDVNPDKLAIVQGRYGDQFRYYSTDEAILNDPAVDAIVIATPHYDHPLLAIAGLKAGKHVLVEKPSRINVSIDVQSAHESNLSKSKRISRQWSDWRVAPYQLDYHELVSLAELL